MALSLFIYPQNNPDGAYVPAIIGSVTNVATWVPPTGTEFVTDPKFTVTGASGMASWEGGGLVPSLEVMMQTSYLPTSQWQGYFSNGDGCVLCLGSNPSGALSETTAPTFGTYNSGSNYYLQLNGNSVGGFGTGVYQKISGLTPNDRYIIRITIRGSGVVGDQLTIGSNFLANGSGNWISVNGTPLRVMPTNGQYNHATFSTSNPNGGHHYGTAITGIIEQEFEAIDPEEIVCIFYTSDTTDNYLQIKEISILPKGASPGYNTWNQVIVQGVDAHNGMEMLDLMDDKNIPISLSIDNFKNVGEKTQSYSKAFNLPSTKHNNRIFNNLYDVTIASGTASGEHFNIHRRTRAILKDNSFTIFEGYLKLIAIKEKDGVPTYNVNLFSDSISLKQALNQKTFAHLDGGTLGGGLGLSELQHDYNRTSITQSWYGNLPITALPVGYVGAAGTAGDITTDALKYPFCRWNSNIQVSDGTGTLPPIGSPVLTALEDAFRPFIKIKYLFDRVISEAGFSYSSDFLSSSEFTKLYMDMNWGKDFSMMPTSTTVTAHQNGDPSNIFGTSYSNLFLNSLNIIGSATAITALENIGYNGTTHVFTAPVTTTTYNFDARYRFKFVAASGATTCHFHTRVIHQDSSGNIISQQTFLHTVSILSSATWNYTGTFVCNQNDTIQFQCKKNVNAAPNNGGVEQRGAIALGTPYNHLITICDTNPQLNSGSLLTKRGKIKQWDFVKDIFSMFNLVSMQDRENPNNLIIEPYQSVFVDDSASSYITIKTLDWTDRVDADSMDIKPLKLKKTIKFDYKKPKDYANKVYTEETGLQFGSFEIDATGFDMATGEQKIALKVFSPTFNTPIFDDFNVILTVPHITGGELGTGADGSVDNNPRILYDAFQTGTPNPMSIAPDVYRIPAANGVTSAHPSDFSLFSHLSEHPSDSNTNDLNFGAHQIVGYGGNSPVNNLFTTYWQPYFDELYHVDTRVVKLSINLSAEDMSVFNFNSKIRIKNRLYRANKIDYKPEALSKVELILLP